MPQAWALLGRLQPSAVFTSGGYLGIPLVMAARARGIPSLVWEGNVVAGRATAAVGRMATRVAVSFPPTLATFPGRAFVSGTPIRSFDGADRQAARALLRRPPEDSACCSSSAVRRRWPASPMPWRRRWSGC